LFHELLVYAYFWMSENSKPLDFCFLEAGALQIQIFLEYCGDEQILTFVLNAGEFRLWPHRWPALIRGRISLSSL